MSAELKVVAYGFLGPWKERNKLDWRPRNKMWEPLIKLSDAQSALQAQAEDHAAEIRRIRDIRNENAEEYRTEIRLCREEIAALKATADEDAHVIERLGTLLALVSIALKGDELPLHRHSYHDLADVADAIKLELDLYRAAFPNGILAEFLDSARAAGVGEGKR